MSFFIKNFLNKSFVKNFSVYTLILSGTLLTVSDANAVVRVNARDYIPAPAGTDLYINYFIHLEGDEFNVNGTSIGDSDLTVDVGLLRMVHYMDFFGMIIDPQFILPVGSVDLNLGGAGSPFDQNNITVGDPLITATFWVLNDPESKQWFGITPFITVPIGSYDEDKPLGSLGIAENRWEFSPQFGYTKGFGDTGIYFESWFEFTIFGDNDEFTFAGVDGELETDTEYSGQLMLSYDLTPTTVIAARYLHLWGGAQTFNGALFGADKDQHEISFMVEQWVSPRDQIMLEFSTDIDVENGPETSFFQFRYVHVF